MPYCPNGHGNKDSAFCDECGVALTAHAPGDTLNIRSPQASAAVHQNFYVPPPPAAPGRSELHKCPQCGRRNSEEKVFDCMGCGHNHLCERHFDEEYEVCADCAKIRRGEDAATAARWSALEEERNRWQTEATTLKSDLAQRTRQLAESAAELKTLRAEVARLTEDVDELKRELERRRAEGDQQTRSLDDAEARHAKIQRELEAAQTSLRQTQTAHAAALADLQKRLSSAEASLTTWQDRAQSAEAQLAEIHRKEEEIRRKAEEAATLLRAEEKKRKQAQGLEKRRQAEEAEKRRLAEEAEKRKQEAQKPRWQQIGIEMIPIPAGRFLYGDNKQLLDLPEFAIAKTPVTNAQYKAFVDATGYTAPSDWRNRRIPNGKEQHPVVSVSWQDAQAFCQWAEVRLPTEKEWEKAARGTDGRTYPWGEANPDSTRCNFNKAWDIKQVGQYPAGASPYGLLDMAGNVWEWCEDWYDSSQKHRVLRGGSFLDNERVVRCAFRDRSNEDGRFNIIGFRVVAPGFWPLAL